jgi:hypothetical protein
MPPQLSQSYKFKYFYFNKNPIVVGPLVILDPNVVFSSHGLLAFSLPFFFPCSSYLSFTNLDLKHNENVVTSLNESPCPRKKGLPIYLNPTTKNKIMIPLESLNNLGVQNFHRLSCV